MTIAEFILQDVQRELPMTRRVLAQTPDDKLDWQSHPEVHTISWNVDHLVDVASWTPTILVTADLDISPEGGADPPAHYVKQSDFLAAFDRNAAATIKSLQGVSDATMAEPWSLKTGSHTLFTMNKGDCLRKWIVSHLSHHRGILSTHLRQAGVKINSIFEE